MAADSALVSEGVFPDGCDRAAPIRVAACPTLHGLLKTHRVLTVADTGSDARISEIRDLQLKPYGIGAALLVGVQRANQIVGLLSFGYVGSSREWTPEEQEFAVSVADLIWAKFEGSEHRRWEAALREEREAMLRFSNKLAWAASPEEAGRLVAKESRRLFRHDAFVFDFFDAATQTITPLYLEDTALGASEPQEVRETVEVRPPSWDNPALKGECALINRIEEPTETPFRTFGNNNRLSRSLMFAPIRWEGRVVGFLSAQSYTPSFYREADLKLLEVLAGQCGGALARLRAQAELAAREEHLHQSQKMQAIGRLAGGLANDFNNMLTVILDSSRILLDQFDLPGRVREEIELIGEAGERASALTTQLLTLSRQQVVVPRTMDLNAIVADSKDMLRRLVGQGVISEVKLDPALRSVRADPVRIVEVIVNLATNARDEMPNGGRLTIRTSNVVLEQSQAKMFGLPAGPYAEMAVSDTGPGMEPEVLSKVFEPFFTTRGRAQSTGLGLFMVYHTVRQSGGYILVESAPGQGTTFRLFLPQAKADVPSQMTPPFPRRLDAARNDPTVGGQRGPSQAQPEDPRTQGSQGSRGGGRP